MKRIAYLGCTLAFLFAIGIIHLSAETVDEVFQHFRAAYEKSENFSADFTETTFRGNTKSTAQGRLVFSKPNLLRKEYVSQNDPNQLVQLIVIDGEYSWSYTPLLNQVNKMKWNQSDRKELLPGIGASLEDVQKNYDMTLVPDTVANAKDVYHIELTPKPHMLPKTTDGESPPREALEVWVQSGEWLPVQFGYQSESDNGERMSVIVSLTNIKRDQDLDADTFHFVPPDDAEVIDISPDH